MSGKYIGKQRILKNINSLVHYIPYAATSLNLIRQSAVDCWLEAVSFFDIIQRLYAFFVASTHRWGVLMTHVKKQPERLVPKYPYDTRWSEICLLMSAKTTHLRSTSTRDGVP